MGEEEAKQCELTREENSRTLANARHVGQTKLDIIKPGDAKRKRFLDGSKANVALCVGEGSKSVPPIISFFFQGTKFSYEETVYIWKEKLQVKKGILANKTG